SDGTRARWAHDGGERLIVAGPRRAFTSTLYREADALTELARHFIACVTNGRAPISGAASARQTIAVLEACARAWRDGQPCAV
ncbi:MAG TPA: hypothetical protein VLM79_28955, partial [Kofleriaceae bacterium]|nr:hypothetical protein [Kofleriaceae bacterium]